MKIIKNVVLLSLENYNQLEKAARNASIWLCLIEA